MEIVIPVEDLHPDWSELLADELGQRDITLVAASVEENPGGYHLRVRYAGDVLTPNDVLELQLAMVGEGSEGALWPEVTLDDEEFLDGLEEEDTEIDPNRQRARIPA